MTGRATSVPRLPRPAGRSGVLYVRQVGLRFQARPWRDGRRHNLGLFATREEAECAVRQFFRRSAAVARPRFVYRSPLSDPPRYYGRVRLTLPDGTRITHRTPAFFFEQEAADALDAYLRSLFDRWVEAVLTRR